MFYDNKALTLLNMDVVGAPHRWAQGEKVSLPKICHTYPEVMKLGTVIPCLDKIKKIYEYVTHTLISAGISIFQWKSAKFAISRNTDIDCTLILNF